VRRRERKKDLVASFCRGLESVDSPLGSSRRKDHSPAIVIATLDFAAQFSLDSYECRECQLRGPIRDNWR
jgi:hypothetical protein